MRAVIDVTELGVTDYSEAFDAAIDTFAELVLVPADNPAHSLLNAKFFPALPVKEIGEGTPIAPESDRWAATFIPNVSGDYRLFGRYSIDGGQTFSLCDSVGLVTPPRAPVAPIVTIAAGVCVPNPCVSPPASTCSGNSLIWRSRPGSCTRAVDDTATCSYSTNYFSCWYHDGCDPVEGTCVAVYSAPSKHGDLVITELMRRPRGTDPALGEWVEFDNRSGLDLDLRGCELVNEAGQRFVFASPGPFFVAASARTSLWGSKDSNKNGGAYLNEPEGRELTGFRLANVAGSLILTCGGVLIDTVAWTVGWPGAEGVSMQLSSDSVDATANDSPTSWCDSVTSYGYGAAPQLGTPDRVNRLCP